MTQCPKGEHELPDEDEIGAHCEEHGVTLLWHGPPITPEDVAPDPSGRAQTAAAPCHRVHTSLRSASTPTDSRPQPRTGSAPPRGTVHRRKQ